MDRACSSASCLLIAFESGPALGLTKEDVEDVKSGRGAGRDTSTSKSGMECRGDTVRFMSGVLGGLSSLTGLLDSFSGLQRVSSMSNSGGEGGGVGAVSTTAVLVSLALTTAGVPDATGAVPAAFPEAGCDSGASAASSAPAAASVSIIISLDRSKSSSHCKL